MRGGDHDLSVGGQTGWQECVDTGGGGEISKHTDPYMTFWDEGRHGGQHTLQRSSHVEIKRIPEVRISDSGGEKGIWIQEPHGTKNTGEETMNDKSSVRDEPG